MLSDKFLFCFAINMFYLHSNSVISGAGDILTSEHVVNIHGTRTNVADSLHQQFTVIIKDMDEESEERDGVPVRGNFKNFICYFLLRINGITRSTNM